MPVRLSEMLCGAVVLSTLSTGALAADLNCDVGPVTKAFGGTSWLVYSCHDDRNVVVVTAPGNPAMPFYFSVSLVKDEVQLHGEGTGRKDLTDAAYKDIAGLREQDIAALITETRTVAPPNRNAP
jgi:hypothetical protein